MRLVLAALLVFALCAGGRAVSHANGRAPATNRVYFGPTDNQSIYVRTTFGLLISKDDGCTFHWVCEQNVGYGGTFDPKYAIAADGTIFATTFTGLRVSRDGGCTFTTATAELPVGAPGRIADVWVDALDIGPNGEIWIATAETGKPNDIFSSKDGGATFSSRGMLSPTIFWKSVKVARTDPQRVYITGYEVTTASDGGMTPVAHVFASSEAVKAGSRVRSPEFNSHTRRLPSSRLSIQRTRRSSMSSPPSRAEATVTGCIARATVA